MHIFYVNVIEQNAGWGAEWFVNKAFSALGHITYCVDYRKARDRLYKWFLDAPRCDVFFLQRGDYFPLPLIKAIQVPRFFWASELVSRCRDQDRLIKSGLFDHVFLRTNSCVDQVVKNGWIERGKCSVLLSGFDEAIHRSILDIEKDIDVLFVGSITSRRKKLLEQIGSRYKLVTASAFGEDFVRLVNRAKVVLNIHAEDFLDTETRVFEVLGCGGFLLSEHLSAENPFSEQDLVQVDSPDDLIDKIQYYIDHDQERETIARHGHTTALNAHTYTHRAKEIIEVMSQHVIPVKDQEMPMLKKGIRFYLYGIYEALYRTGKGIYDRGYALAAKGKNATKSFLLRINVR